MNINDNDSPSQKKRKKQAKEERRNDVKRNKKISDLIAFKEGVEPECIIGCTACTGEILLLMKWKGIDECSFIRSTDGRVKCPKLLIDYYESRITWE